MSTIVHSVVGRGEQAARITMRPVPLSPEQVGARIRQAREEKEWSRYDLAVAMDVHPSSIQRWEEGKLPSVRKLVRLAEVLDLDATELTEPPEHRAQLDDLMTSLASLRELVELVRDESERGRLAALVSLESIDRRLSKLEARRAPRASGSSQA